MRSFRLVCIFALVTFAASAQQVRLPDTRVSDSLTRFESQDWRTRKAAFEDITKLALEGENQSSPSQYPEVVSRLVAKYPEQADRGRLGFIQLLSTENDAVHGARQRNLALGEDHSEYYSSLIGTVAALKDERAVPALIGAITTGGMATRGLAEFGTKALPPVLEEIRSPDPMVRASVLHVLRNMLKMGKDADPVSHAQLKKVLRSSITDPEFVVRSSAVSAIENLRDREEFVPVLKQIAENDPAKVPGQADGGGELYPVRLAAKRVLAKIEQHYLE